MRRNRFLFLGVVGFGSMLGVVLVLLFVNSVQAASGEVVAYEDTYITASDPTSSQNGAGLLVGNDGTRESQIILLKFDLRSPTVTIVIAQARLNLAGIYDLPNCGWSADTPASMLVFSTTNGWSEGTTWNDVMGGTPVITRGASALDDLDSAHVAGAHAYWTDPNSIGNDDLASYLESQRGGFASLWIEVPSALDYVLFEDREGSIASSPSACASADLTPTLQIADGVVATGPLVVSVSEFDALGRKIPAFGISVGLLLIVTTSLVFYRRRLRAQ